MVVHPIEYRYGSPEMRAIFTKDRWVEYAKKVELSLLKALAKRNIISMSDADVNKLIESFKKVEYDDVRRYESILHHETMALVKALSEVTGVYGRYIHLGLTSNDVLDNILMLQIKEALNIIINKLRTILSELKKLALKELNTPILGRTHGRAAIPVTFGFKISLYIDELYRSYVRLTNDLELIAGKIGGAVGSQVELYPLMRELEKDILMDLGLKKASFYTQILPRDRIAYILEDLLILSTLIEHFGNEIRNLQRSEIDEVEEGFKMSQVGSSVMPHKKNPIKSEKLCGLSRLLRGYASSILENIVLDHERDLRNSSLERVVIPEVFMLVDEQLNTMLDIIKNIRIKRENMLSNIQRFIPEIFSDILIQRGTLRGGDRQVLHEKLRMILAVEGVKNVEDFISKIEKDDYLRKFINKKDILELMSLDIFIKAAAEKARELLDNIVI